MAKSTIKEQKPSSSTDDIFALLISQHNSISPDIAAIGTEMNSAVSTWIDSGSLGLNMILSNRPDGGYPCGKIIEVFGRESIGKSTLGYVAMANTQRAGGIVIYADIERGGNPKFMEMLGVDLSKLVTTNEETIENLFLAIETNLRTIVQSGRFKGKPIFVMIDSVTALQTDAEMEGGYKFNMNVSMGIAKQLGKALKKILSSLGRANACMYIVNQIRDNVSGYGPAYTTGGGKALKFYASTRLYLEGKQAIVAKNPVIENEFKETMAKWKEMGGNKSGIPKPEKPKADEATIGYTVAAYTIKNKVAPPDRRAHFNIIFSQGLDDKECWLDYCIKYGIVKASGAWNEIVGFKNDYGKFYSSSWLEILSDKEIYDQVEALLIDKLTIKLKEKGDYGIPDVMTDEEKKMIEALKADQEHGGIE